MTQNSVNSKNPLIQSIYNISNSAVTITSYIPIDGSVPQKTEGNEVMTCSITPTKSTNLIIVKAFVWARLSANPGANFSMALFQDDTSNAIAVSKPNITNAAGWLTNGMLYFAKVSGTTSSTTFKLRCGRYNTNYVVNYAEFGGVQTSSMEVMEIKA